MQRCGRPKHSFAETPLARRQAAPFGIETHRKNDSVTTENWAEERERLVRLLAGIESGSITHVDEGDFRQLQATSPQNIAALKERLAELNSRLGLDRED